MCKSLKYALLREELIAGLRRIRKEESVGSVPVEEVTLTGSQGRTIWNLLKIVVAEDALEPKSYELDGNLSWRDGSHWIPVNLVETTDEMNTLLRGLLAIPYHGYVS